MMTRISLSIFTIVRIIPIVAFTECCALMHQGIKLAATFSRRIPSSTGLNFESWGVADNWSDLSSEAEEARTAIREDQLIDPVGVAVGILEATTSSLAPGADNAGDDESLSFDVTQILIPFLEDTNSISSSSEQAGSTSESTVEQEAEEIGFMIRCNQIPNTMLAGEGRGMQPLSDEEKYDLSQLLMVVPDESTGTQTENIHVTSFFHESICSIFQRHSSFDSTEGVRVLDKNGVAKWMTTCLQDESVSKNDKRVLEGIELVCIRRIL